MPDSGVPIACTLHPNEMGARLEEWHGLVAAHVEGIQRPAPTLDRLAGIAERAARAPAR